MFEPGVGGDGGGGSGVGGLGGEGGFGIVPLVHCLFVILRFSVGGPGFSKQLRYVVL